MEHGWIIYDEFLFMKPAALEALFPTFLTGASGAMISSLSPDTSLGIMGILQAKYRDGTEVIKVINWIQVKFIYVNILNRFYNIS